MSGTDEFYVRCVVGSTLYIENVASTAANLSTNTWYFIEIAYDTTLGATDYVDVYVNGTRRINSVQALPTLVGATMYLCDPAELLDADAFMDNVMISDDPTRDFYGGGTGLCVATEYPG